MSSQHPQGKPSRLTFVRFVPFFLFFFDNYSLLFGNYTNLTLYQILPEPTLNTTPSHGGRTWKKTAKSFHLQELGNISARVLINQSVRKCELGTLSFWEYNYMVSILLYHHFIYIFGPRISKIISSTYLVQESKVLFGCKKLY